MAQYLHKQASKKVYDPTIENHIIEIYRYRDGIFHYGHSVVHDMFSMLSY